MVGEGEKKNAEIYEILFTIYINQRLGYQRVLPSSF